jgi:hypothetical protein
MEVGLITAAVTATKVLDITLMAATIISVVTAIIMVVVIQVPIFTLANRVLVFKKVEIILALVVVTTTNQVLV